jgi:hypothetical protein
VSASFDGIEGEKKSQKKCKKKIKPQKVVKVALNIFLFSKENIFLMSHRDEKLFLAFYRAQSAFIVVSMQK